MNVLHGEVLWGCFPICFSCLAPWSLARAPERRCFTVPTPVHRLHFLILLVETPRIGTTAETDGQAAAYCVPSVDCICLEKITYCLCFCCNTECCPSLPCFPPSLLPSPVRNSPSCVTRQEKHPPMSFRSVSRTTARINYLRGWNQTHLCDSGQACAVG